MSGSLFACDGQAWSEEDLPGADSRPRHVAVDAAAGIVVVGSRTGPLADAVGGAWVTADGRAPPGMLGVEALEEVFSVIRDGDRWLAIGSRWDAATAHPVPVAMIADR